MRLPRDTVEHFRQECIERGLAVTHQRMIIFEALAGAEHHPSPEEVYERVRKQIPSISLGTVYKNIKTFIEHGLLREVSLHHGSARLEMNLHPHHHLVCARCKAIIDLSDDALEPLRMKTKPPAGFEIHRYSVEVIGICKKCSSKTQPGDEPQPGIQTHSARAAKSSRKRTGPASSGRANI